MKAHSDVVTHWRKRKRMVSTTPIITLWHACAKCPFNLSVSVLCHYLSNHSITTCSICIHWHMGRSKSILTSFSTRLFHSYCSPSQLTMLS